MDNLVYGHGAAGGGIGRLEFERELLVCNDPLEKDLNGVGHGQEDIFEGLGRLFLYFLSIRMWIIVALSVKSSFPMRHNVSHT